MSDSKNFIIKVPAGADHQEYAALFSPTKVHKDHKGFYGISLDAGLLRSQLPEGVKMPDVKLAKRERPVRETVYVKSETMPIIATRGGEGDSADTPTVTMHFFRDYFHDLHWIGLTPDRVIRYVSKQILVNVATWRHPITHIDITVAMLKGVMLNRSEIVQVIENLHKERTSELDL